MSNSQLRRGLSLLPTAALLFLAMQTQQVLADTSASVSLSEPFVSNTSASDYQPDYATATLLGVTGNAKSVLATGSVGVGIDMSPGTNYGFYNAAASWDDAWTASGSYFGPAPVAPTFTLNGSIATNLLSNYDGFFELSFHYRIDGNDMLSFTAYADGGATKFSAYNSNGDNITSSLVFTPNATNPTTLTDFSLSYSGPTVYVGFSTGTGGSFTDIMSVSLMVDGGGPLTIDAYHSFHANLTSLDPNIILTDAGGRSAVAAVPEPEIYAMLGVGLGLMGWVGRRRKLQAA
jgi:hypothetical protein